MKINKKIIKIVSKLNNINIKMVNLIERGDSSYDCKTDFRVYRELVYEGRFIIQFNHIKGNFNCWRNNLISLEGCPEIVDGDFYIGDNHLKLVAGEFFWNDNSKKEFTEQEVKENCKIKGNINIEYNYWW